MTRESGENQDQDTDQESEKSLRKERDIETVLTQKMILTLTIDLPRRIDRVNTPRIEANYTNHKKKS